MTIVHALFVPKGTIDKSGFMVAALLLIALGAGTDVLSFTAPMLGPALFFVGLLFAYCWVALWIKRFHAAGASGWWTVLVVLVWIILESIVMFTIIMSSGLEMETLISGDNAAVQAAMTEAAAQAAIPSLIGSAVVSLVVALGLNAILPDGRYKSEGEAASPD